MLQLERHVMRTPGTVLNVNILSLALIFLLATGSTGENFDVTSPVLRSIEYLVDHSNQIAIVDFGNKPDAEPEIRHVLKGLRKDVKFPLKHPKMLGRTLRGPTNKGRIRLVFVENGNQLLGSTDLARVTDTSTLLDREYYGVDQFGKLLMSERDLLDAIRKRMEIGKQNRSPFHHRRVISSSGTKGVIVYAPRGFALNTTEEVSGSI